MVVSFPREHQEILIDTLKRVENRIKALAQSSRTASPNRIRLEKVA